MASRSRQSGSGKKSNILVNWGDDIGIYNLSCYGHGTMGYRTPHIDRLVREGMMFTDSYGEQSCSAGRSSFIQAGTPFFCWVNATHMHFRTHPRPAKASRPITTP